MHSGLVLTGGTALLPGMEELGEEVFHLPVRMGVPHNVLGFSEVVRNPRFATAVGLLLYARQESQKMHLQKIQGVDFGQIMGRMKSWFQGNF